MHALARQDGQPLGYAAIARRFIGAGDDEVLIAGTGCGSQVVTALQDAINAFAPADFGCLGCRKGVVHFNEACGYARIDSFVLDVSPRPPVVAEHLIGCDQAEVFLHGDLTSR